MKNIQNYNTFLFETLLADVEMIEIFNDADILESIVTDSDSLLKSINAEKLDLFTTFHINPDSYDRNMTIEFLYDDGEFNKQLTKLKLKKNKLESTEESDTFIDKTLTIKFFSVYDEDKSELDQPEYIIFQSRSKAQSQWSDITCYKVNEDMKNFYDKLTSKTVEIKKDDKTYIYNTSNSGSDWILQNSNDKNDIFKADMSSDDIRAILKDKNTSITILA